MPAYDFDVLVIGAGPAGEAAALNAGKHGLRTGVVHNRPQVGGACTHLGTIPSKSLRHAVKEWMAFNSNPAFRDLAGQASISFPRLRSFAQDVIRKQVRMRSKFYQRNRIALHHGQARFIDPHHLRIALADGGEETLSAGRFIIATGSRPYRPPEVDFTHPRLYDSDTILDMAHTPRRLIIYGAGIIGCEYASIFAGIGIKVDLVNTRQQLMEFLDDEIADALSYHLRDCYGVTVRHREQYERIQADDHGVTLQLKSGKTLHGDALLWCNGRTGNTDRLGLEALGLHTDARGYLPVNEHYQTAVAHILAAGDVIGWPSLASAAYNQGRSAAASARGKARCQHVDDVPVGIYTIPEISSVGATESDLTERCIPYEIGRAFFKETARAQISGEETGLLKILFHPQTRQVLGIHCFGAEATEIIHIGQAILKQSGAGNCIDYFVNTTFNYPTMAEAYRIAALNGINRLQGSGEPTGA